MRKFLFRCFFSCIPLLACVLLSGRYDPQEGGLIRMSYLPSLQQYSTQSSNTQGSFPDETLKFYNDSSSRSIAIFGDSFIRNGEGPPFWSALTQDYNIGCFRQQDFTNSNPFILAFGAKDTLQSIFGQDPDIIIIETIERHLIKRTKYFSKDNTLQPKKIIPQEKKSLDFVQKIDVGWKMLCGLMKMPYAQSQRRVHQWKASNLPLHQQTSLLTYADDLNHRLPNYDSLSINAKVDSVIHQVQLKYPHSEIQLLIIPDKLTIYEQFLTNPPKKSSILKHLNWKSAYLKIRLDEALQILAKEGIFELYTYSGTHFGHTGAHACEQQIRFHLNSDN